MIAEIFSIFKALVWVEENLQPCQIVILTDSKTAIQSLESNSNNYQLVNNTLYISRQLFGNNFEITLQWTPLHIDIERNEMADEFATRAIQLPNITRPHI